MTAPRQPSSNPSRPAAEPKIVQAWNRVRHTLKQQQKKPSSVVRNWMQAIEDQNGSELLTLIEKQGPSLTPRQQAWAFGQMLKGFNGWNMVPKAKYGEALLDACLDQNWLLWNRPEQTQTSGGSYFREPQTHQLIDITLQIMGLGHQKALDQIWTLGQDVLENPKYWLYDQENPMSQLQSAWENNAVMLAKWWFDRAGNQTFPLFHPNHHRYFFRKALLNLDPTWDLSDKGRLEPWMVETIQVLHQDDLTEQRAWYVQSLRDIVSEDDVPRLIKLLDIVPDDILDVVQHDRSLIGQGLRQGAWNILSALVEDDFWAQSWIALSEQKGGGKKKKQSSSGS